MDEQGRQTEAGAPDGLRERVERLEAAWAAWEHEVRTRRLVVVDGDGSPRIVGQVVNGVAELRVEIPVGPGHETMAALFAAPRAYDWGISSGVGLQLWVDGDCVHELARWADLP